MTEVTRILSQIESGDPSAAEELLPMVYEELRKLAARHGVPVVAIAFDMSPRTYHARNRDRAGRVVDDEVVERQIELMALTMAALPSEGYAGLYQLREAESVEVVRDRG